MKERREVNGRVGNRRVHEGRGGVKWEGTR